VHTSRWRNGARNAGGSDRPPGGGRVSPELSGRGTGLFRRGPLLLLKDSSSPGLHADGRGPGEPVRPTLVPCRRRRAAGSPACRRRSGGHWNELPVLGRDRLPALAALALWWGAQRALVGDRRSCPVGGLHPRRPRPRGRPGAAQDGPGARAAGRLRRPPGPVRRGRRVPGAPGEPAAPGPGAHRWHTAAACGRLGPRWTPLVSVCGVSLLVLFAPVRGSRYRLGQVPAGGAPSAAPSPAAGLLGRAALRQRRAALALAVRDAEPERPRALGTERVGDRDPQAARQAVPVPGRAVDRADPAGGPHEIPSCTRAPRARGSASGGRDPGSCWWCPTTAGTADRPRAGSRTCPARPRGPGAGTAWWACRNGRRAAPGT